MLVNEGLRESTVRAKVLWLWIAFEVFHFNLVVVRHTIRYAAVTDHARAHANLELVEVGSSINGTSVAKLFKSQISLFTQDEESAISSGMSDYSDPLLRNFHNHEKLICDSMFSEEEIPRQNQVKLDLGDVGRQVDQDWIGLGLFVHTLRLPGFFSSGYRFDMEFDICASSTVFFS